MKITMMKLKKRFGSNMPGETCGFSEEAVAHLKKHDAGEVVAEFDDATHRFDPKTQKVIDLAPAAKAEKPKEK